MATFRGNTGQCGGTILSDTKILTAAHCFTSEDDTALIYVGNYKQSAYEEGEFVVEATQVKIHEDYQSTTEQAYDFAMLEVPSLSGSKPENCAGCYSTACLPSKLPEVQTSLCVLF